MIHYASPTQCNAASVEAFRLTQSILWPAFHPPNWHSRPQYQTPVHRPQVFSFFPGTSVAGFIQWAHWICSSDAIFCSQSFPSLMCFSIQQFGSPQPLQDNFEALRNQYKAFVLLFSHSFFSHSSTCNYQQSEVAGLDFLYFISETNIRAFKQVGKVRQ